jgi:23S rRNA pseudouridine2605 synthase
MADSGIVGEGAKSRTVLRAVIEATGISRRKAFAAIRDGVVTVGGRPATEPSAPYSGGAITVDGRPAQAQAAEKAYLLLNKPAGVITANSDSRGRRTVLDLVPVEMRLRGLHAVGRLDQDTTGLLLLTNDGDFTYRLTHPSHEVEKEYWLTSRPPLTSPQLQALRDGVEIDGAVRVPAEVAVLAPDTGFEVAIVVREGRKRQVRRMLEAVGARVTGLRRVREATLRLGGLPEGSVRRLTAAEVRWLMESSAPSPKGPQPAAEVTPRGGTQRGRRAAPRLVERPRRRRSGRSRRG